MSKVRCDFVTNSSSSSFVIQKKDYGVTKNLTESKLKDILNSMLNCHNEIFEENLKYSDVFSYVAIPEIEKVKKAFSDNCWGDGNSYIDCDYDEEGNEIQLNSSKTYLEEAMEGDFVIFSEGENSIPYDIIGYIQEVLDATSHHLG